MVQRVDKMTGTRQAAIPYALAHLGKPYDLVNVPEECPNLSNTCQVSGELKLETWLMISVQGEPCGAGRLCLPDGEGSHKCK